VVEEVDIDGKFDIYVSTDGDEYEKYNNVASLNAAYIYLECHDNFSLGSQSNWYGTIFSDQDISFSDSINLVGSYYTNGDTIFLGNAINITYVQSNYAKENW
jgi:hypothetical protein